MSLSDTFRYDPDSGQLLRLFKSGRVRVAGSKNKTGDYTRVGFMGSELKAHHVVWELFYGRSPVGFIDHINGDKADNRIENLREATDSENKRNVGKRSHNNSGFKGVSWDKVNKKWMSHATLDGKGFTIGRYATPEEAASQYDRFAREHHGEFYREGDIK